MRGILIAAMLLIAITGLGYAEDAPRLQPGEKWVYGFAANLANAKDVESKIALIKRAKAAGYTGIVMADSKLAKFELMDDNYIHNVQKVRKVCADEGFKFIVPVGDIGYSNELLTNDPNLAEGLPVRNAGFVVKEGKLVPDAAEGLELGALEAGHGKWELGAFKADPDVKYQGKPTVLYEAGKGGGQGRIVQKIQVKPYHYYHVTVMAKTEGFTCKDNRIQAYAAKAAGGGFVLDWQPILSDPKVGDTADWRQLHTTFSSLDNTEINLMIGTWGPKEGKLWLADVKVEPGGFVNVLRRDSCPLTLTSADGQTTYQEGKDFAPVKDDKLLHDPNPGYSTIWHDAPVVSVPAGSQLKDGQKVLASYNFMASCGKPNQVTVCLAEPKLYDIFEKQITWVKKNIDPDGYHIGVDEIRVGGFDDACVKSGKTPGQLLAAAVKKCTELVHKIAPGKLVLTWNDMFDPYHNAPESSEKHNGYLTKAAEGKGAWAGSWEGVSPEVIVMDWMKKPESAKFWSDRGNQVILAGYYDKAPEAIVDWMKAVKAEKNVVGIMYTTWNGVSGFKDLEAFIAAAKGYEAENK